MNLLKTVFLIILLSINTFASTSAPPPPPPHQGWEKTSYLNEIEKYKTQCVTENCTYIADFLKAQLWALHNSKKACTLFSELATKQNHSLYPISLIKSQEFCNLNKKQKSVNIELIQNFILKNKPASWLLKYLRQSLVNLGDQNEVFNLLPLLKSKREKESFIQETIAKSNIKKSIKNKLKKELTNISPRFGTPSLAAAQDAISSGEIEQGIKILNSLRRISEDQKKQKLELLRQAYKLSQNKSEALKFNKKIYYLDKVNFQKKPDSTNAFILLQSSLNYARAAWTLHNPQLALKVLNEAEKILKNKTSIADIYFIISRIYEERNLADKAFYYLELALNEAKKDSQLYVYILWNYGWLNFKSSNYDNAKKYFEELLDLDTIEPGRKSQTLFWLGQIAKRQKNFNKANDYFNKIKKEDPFGYYSVIAYKELGERIPALEFDSEERRKKYPNNFNIDLFENLILVGQFKYAQSMLDSELNPEKDHLWLYKKAQYFSPIFNYWAKLDNNDKASFLKENGDYLYPIVYKNLVLQASELSGLWPEYIWAIMRQESGFNPNAQSPANAFGLMQLLPAIAKNVSNKAKINYSTTNDLFDPSISIRLGAKHLRDYWDEFKGNFVLSTASYNSSSNAVKSWIKTKPTNDILIFIEEIPYEETRNYVKLVLRNLVNYMRFNSQQSSIEFPYWALNKDF
ncbi:MAG: transglycosylase SLT domain-containing protein [Oligoflexia bacterium]|nr:transglycosylase SLT domain-containing protein [Oligoflexia bacterium]